MPPKPKTANQIDAMEALTQAAAAHLLGVGSRTLRDAHDAPRNDDGTYPGPALVAWYIARQQASKTGDDLLDADADSPALERYRAARAGLAEIELAERQGASIPAEVVKTHYTLVGGIMRQLADRFRRIDPPAHEALEEAWDDVAHAWDRWMETHMKGEDDVEH